MCVPKLRKGTILMKFSVWRQCVDLHGCWPELFTSACLFGTNGSNRHPLYGWVMTVILDHGVARGKMPHKTQGYTHTNTHWFIVYLHMHPHEQTMHCRSKKHISHQSSTLRLCETVKRCCRGRQKQREERVWVKNRKRQTLWFSMSFN